MGEEEDVSGTVEVKVDPWTGRPRQPRQDELDMEVGSKLDDLFDHINQRFCVARRHPRPGDPEPVSPKTLSEMLRPYDLEDAFQDWWFGDSDDGETNDDGELWDGGKG